MIGFDSELYIKLQKENIKKRLEMFSEKLYIEFGGKLFDDMHAARVLPGFNANNKIKVLEGLKDISEIILCISSKDIEKNKIRDDKGISYTQEAILIIQNLRSVGLKVSSVVITLFEGQIKAQEFANKLKQLDIEVYFHTFTKGYPTDVNVIVSEEGYGANPYIKTTMPLVVVTAPGACSGKLATCLSQLYHEHKKGVNAGYAKFETFPVWNLPLKHRVNKAYEAATADLGDRNMIDPYHYEKYEQIAINYNRDITVFPVLKNILKRIVGRDIYFSPTDMGVNMAGHAIVENDIITKASNEEIIRRFLIAKSNYHKGLASEDVYERMKVIMSECELSPYDREVYKVSKELSKELDLPVCAIRIKNKVITGKSKGILSASAACVLNVLKYLADIKDKKKLISEDVLKPILDLKRKTSLIKIKRLELEEVLIALSMCASTDQNAKNAYEQIGQLSRCDAHSSHNLSVKENNVFKNLNVYITSSTQLEQIDITNF